MEEVIHYLEMKNRYYEKFYSITQKFLEMAQEDQWQELNLFVDNRERILNIIRSFDFKVAALFDALDMKQINLAAYRAKIKGLFEARERWVQKIVTIDLQLISRIDEIKSETIRDLKKAVELEKGIEQFKENQPDILRPARSRNS